MRKYVDETLPRGIHKRGNSLVVSFALADGSIERRSVGIFGVISIADALRDLLNFKQQVKVGTYQKRQPAPPKEIATTVADLWPVYLQNYTDHGGRDAGRQTIAWNRLEPTFGEIPVSELTTTRISAYIKARKKQGMSNGTVNRELSVLQAMLRLGTKFTVAGGKPMVTFLPAFPSKLEEGDPRTNFIQDPQYEVLIANAKEPWLRAFVECCYAFGFRKSELLNLRKKNVDLLGRWIGLDGSGTKSGKARKVKMTSRVYDRLCECIRGKEETDFVFTRPDGSNIVDLRLDWYNLCVASKLGHWEPATRKNGEKYEKYVGLIIHDFRRSAIRNMKRRGISDTVAMKISGHTTRSVFDRYNITDETDLENAAQLIEDGGQVRASTGTDTKTSTSGYAHS
jgi:integrase